MLRGLGFTGRLYFVETLIMHIRIDIICVLFLTPVIRNLSLGGAAVGSCDLKA